MLVQVRRVDQSLRIGDGIEITVLRLSGKRVSLGISAPEHVAIIRTELEDGETASAGETITNPSRR